MPHDRLARLVYLTDKLGRPCLKVPRDVRRYIDNWELYEEVAKQGRKAAAVSLGISSEQMQELWRTGKHEGAPTLAEFRLLISDEILTSGRIADLAISKRLSIIGSLSRWTADKADDILEVIERTMQTKGQEIPTKIPKWDTGFVPLDLVLGGCYHGILMLMAPPGHGKTSTMVALMEAIKRTHPQTRHYFFEMEIPDEMMWARIAPALNRTTFEKGDVVITGSQTIEDIQKRLDADPPNPERVVYIDSPDAMPGLHSDSRRLELGHVFRQLIPIKQQSRLVVVASQPRRVDGAAMTIASPAESWEKTWYVDMLCSVAKIGLNRMHMKVLKNRFGLDGQEVQYNFDLESLVVDPALVEAANDEW